MNNQGINNKNNSRKAITNIDTTVKEIKFVRDLNGNAFRRIDAVGMDADEGIVNKVTRNIILDACRSPIMKLEELLGICDICEKPIKNGNGVRCEGRGAELMCLSCYQRQGSHVFDGMKFCRRDYWWSKLFWSHISTIHAAKKEVQDENKGYYRHPEPGAAREAFRDGRYMRPAQENNRQPHPLNINKARQ